MKFESFLAGHRYVHKKVNNLGMEIERERKRMRERKTEREKERERKEGESNNNAMKFMNFD